MSSHRLSLTRPDDWHLHLRDHGLMREVVRHTAAEFRRAIIMPNLKPPVVSVAEAEAYYRRIKQALDEPASFEPLMTLYLTENTPAAEIEKLRHSRLVHAVKYYPAGATTHSDAGVRTVNAIYRVLEAMQQHDVPLLVHAETTDPEVDVFDREAVFIERTLSRITEDFPQLRIVLEHVTTREGIEFVRQHPGRLAATITAHHLLMNRNSLFDQGIRPHHYCLPVLKREQHRQALIAAATSGHPQFFLGTDSAPHLRRHKESACGCAGIYTAHAALCLYAEVFEQAGALERLEQFASFNGPDFYGLPRNRERITLLRQDMEIPDTYRVDGEELVPFRAGGSVRWRLAEKMPDG